MNKNKPYCDVLLFKMLSLNSSETKYLVSVLIAFLQVRKSGKEEANTLEKLY